MVAGPVHFVYLGGRWCWQYTRAVVTARIHGVPIIIWRARGIPIATADELATVRLMPDVEIRDVDLPSFYRDHPIKLANVKDVYAWEILYRHGGLYLDLDTISLRPVWDLLTRDVLVSTEWPDLCDPVAKHPYNSAVTAGRKGAPVLTYLWARSQAVLASGESGWGKCGPHLLTDVVAERPDLFDAAPFGVLSGWRDDTIDAYYDGARPGPDVRVIHLYSSSRPERFLADRWVP